MSYQVRFEEMLDALSEINHPDAEEFTRRYEELGNEMANRLATALEISYSDGDFQGVAFAGFCVPFRPAFEGQALPSAIDSYDNKEEWEFSDG